MLESNFWQSSSYHLRKIIPSFKIQKNNKIEVDNKNNKKNDKIHNKKYNINSTRKEKRWMMDKTKYFYTLKEIKEGVYSDSISITTLQNMVRKNTIPSVRVAGRILIPSWWVDEQIKLATQKPVVNDCE